MCCSYRAEPEGKESSESDVAILFAFFCREKWFIYLKRIVFKNRVLCPLVKLIEIKSFWSFCEILKTVPSRFFF